MGMHSIRPRKAIRSETRGLSRKLSCVDSWLYISGAWPVKPQQIKDIGITCIVNATVELPVLLLENVEVIPVRIQDHSTTNIYQYFHEISDKLETVRKENGCSLVHCVSGVSRSASLILAYLIKYTGLSLKQAYQKLFRCRPCVRPNNGFFNQLIQFEKEILGKNSVQILKVSDSVYIPDVCEEELELFRNHLWSHVIKDRTNFMRQYHPVAVACL